MDDSDEGDSLVAVLDIAYAFIDLLETVLT